MGKQRKYLSLDGMLTTTRACLEQEKLEELERSPYYWQDCVMSGLALFGFKCASLLQFEEQQDQPFMKRNLRRLYHLKHVPSDTCLRERLDLLPPHHLRRPFKKIFSHLQRGKVLDAYRYLDNHYIVSIDGTGHFSSQTVHCKHCCVKQHRSGEKTYYHQMVSAAVVHPEKKVVIPLMPEPITKEDGASKNDCERNASKRLLEDLRREHPHLKVLVVEDALASNHPHLTLLDELGMDYVIGVKEGDHRYLFDWIRDLPGKHHQIMDDDGTLHTFHYHHGVPLNDEHHDYEVNVLQYTERKKNGKEQHFSWVTRMAITPDKVYAMMRAARARWRIENETFNTLKNQGYHFEHNYGHGYQHLCSVMGTLLMLTFLMDQVQQLCCKLYQKARKVMGPFYAFNEFSRALLHLFDWESFDEMWFFIGEKSSRAPPSEALVKALAH